MRTRSCFLLALSFAMGRVVIADFVYSVTDLSATLGINGSVSGINNVGQLVGNSSGINAHAFLYSNGYITDLGTLGGINSFATAINDSGQVVGSSAISSGNDSHAFLYSNGHMMDLGTLGGSISYGYDINDRGQITGASALLSNGFHAYLYSNGQMADLGSLPGPPCCSDINNGIAINNLGQVAGYAYEGVYSFIYSNGQMMDIGSLSGRGATLANGINDAGQVVGSSNTANDNSHAFLYSGGEMTDLGTLGGRTSNASDINNAGQIVGSADVINPVPMYFSADAFIYSNGQMRDLNDLIDPTLQLRLYRANRINDIGQILAEGAPSSEPCCGVPRPYLLTPVPEPDTLGLLGTAVIGLCVWSRCRSTIFR